jgi:hypothetical protein
VNVPIWIFVGNLVSTYCLVGLIWTIQVVHYPSFQYADESTFQEMESFHQTRISLVVVPLMLLEIGTGLLLLWSRPGFVPGWAALCGVLLIGVVWLSTFTLQVPLHGKLSEGMDTGAIQRLVTTNWIRATAWTGRGLLLSWVLLNGLSAWKSNS